MGPFVSYIILAETLAFRNSNLKIVLDPEVLCKYTRVFDTRHRKGNYDTWVVLPYSIILLMIELLYE